MKVSEYCRMFAPEINSGDHRRILAAAREMADLLCREHNGRLRRGMTAKERDALLYAIDEKAQMIMDRIAEPTGKPSPIIAGWFRKIITYAAIGETAPIYGKSGPIDDTPSGSA